MSTTWDTPAATLLEHVADGWEGLWSLLYAASHATVKLSLSVPLTTSVDLKFAAMDIREARDELEWLHEHLVRHGGDHSESVPRVGSAVDRTSTGTVPGGEPISARTSSATGCASPPDVSTPRQTCAQAHGAGDGRGPNAVRHVAHPTGTHPP